MAKRRRKAKRAPHRKESAKRKVVKRAYKVAQARYRALGRKLRSTR